MSNNVENLLIVVKDELKRLGIPENYVHYSQDSKKATFYKQGTKFLGFGINNNQLTKGKNFIDSPKCNEILTAPKTPSNIENIKVRRNGPKSPFSSKNRNERKTARKKALNNATNKMTEVKAETSVFGQELDMIPMCSTKLKDGTIVSVPKFIVDVGNLIRCNISVEGIFRKAGSTQRQNDIKSSLSKGQALKSTAHPIDAACLLKQFLRSMSSPLLNSHVRLLMISCLDLPEEEQKEALSLCSLLLPQTHKDLLAYILELMSAVASASDTNLMDAHNLAIVLAPNLLPSLSSESSFKKGASVFTEDHKLPSTISVIEHLIEGASGICRISNKVSEAVQNREKKLNVSMENLEEPPPSTGSQKKKRRSASIHRLMNGIRRVVQGGSSTPQSHMISSPAPASPNPFSDRDQASEMRPTKFLRSEGTRESARLAVFKARSSPQSDILSLAHEKRVGRSLSLRENRCSLLQSPKGKKRRSLVTPQRLPLQVLPLNRLRGASPQILSTFSPLYIVPLKSSKTRKGSPRTEKDPILSTTGTGNVKSVTRMSVENLNASPTEALARKFDRDLKIRSRRSGEQRKSYEVSTRRSSKDSVSNQFICGSATPRLKESLLAQSPQQTALRRGRPNSLRSGLPVVVKPTNGVDLPIVETPSKTISIKVRQPSPPPSNSPTTLRESLDGPMTRRKSSLLFLASQTPSSKDLLAESWTKRDTPLVSPSSTTAPEEGVEWVSGDAFMEAMEAPDKRVNPPPRGHRPSIAALKKQKKVTANVQLFTRLQEPQLTPSHRRSTRFKPRTPSSAILPVRGAISERRCSRARIRAKLTLASHHLCTTTGMSPKKALRRTPTPRIIGHETPSVKRLRRMHPFILPSSKDTPPRLPPRKCSLSSKKLSLLRQ